MRVLECLSINPGVFIGRAKLIRCRKYHIEKTQIVEEERESELELLLSAIDLVESDIQNYLDQYQISETDKDIIRIHQLILRDPEVLALLEHELKEKSSSAPQAVLNAFNQIVQQFRELDNDFFAQRAVDYKDVAHRLLGSLLGDTGEDYSAWEPDQIAIVQEISPSQVTNFASFNIPAYCSERGAYNSHASILTRAMNITALSAIPQLLELVEEDETLIIDALNSRLIISPDEATLNQYRELLEKYDRQQEELKGAAGQSARTLSGRRIKLMCNIELPQEIDRILELKADGIGLFRTEFLYMGKKHLPTEEEQYQIYTGIAKKMAPHPVTIRTFDLGGDKLTHLIPSPREENPYLGCRGIRFSLAHKEVFKTQIRAILRASTDSNIKVMFPMINDSEDFLKARAIVLECMKELDGKGETYDTDIDLGVMIEVPSAALCAEELAHVCDFFSIGTNDLVQYTLAVDRNNENLSSQYIQHHPAVINLIRFSINAARKNSIPVSVCGEMASIDEYVPLLIGLGINELSINPTAYFRVKNIISHCDDTLDSVIKKLPETITLPEIETLVFKTLAPYYQI
ncbi:MAG: phosphoenolpyruvate--protein phosphotransferase [Candidatus Cloacimonadaceae bacterium]|nr:phosphoenolpyruvate--protein phosphotransferase [Candidatus Cloacimonadaceae bacterium]